MSTGLPKHFSNIVLGVLGILALVHSFRYFGREKCLRQFWVFYFV